MMRRIFVDTSAWFAYANRKDPDHKAIRGVLRGFEGRLVTSNFVFDEVITLCAYRLGHGVAAKVGETLLDPEAIDMIRIKPGDEEGAWRLFLERADKKYSFTDCTSFELMRRLGIGHAVSLDDDFSQEGFDVEPGV